MGGGREGTEENVAKVKYDNGLRPLRERADGGVYGREGKPRGEEGGERAVQDEGPEEGVEGVVAG